MRRYEEIWGGMGRYGEIWGRSMRQCEMLESACGAGVRARVRARVRVRVRVRVRLARPSSRGNIAAVCSRTRSSSPS